MAPTIATPRSGPGFQYDLLSLEDLRVDAGVVIASTNSIAIRALGSGHDVYVSGTVTGYSVGIFLGGPGANIVSNTLFVDETGLVQSGAGSDAVAVAIESSAAAVVNYGTIRASGSAALAAVVLGGVGEALAKVENYGSILGADVGILRSGGTAEAVVIRNFGTISAAVVFDGAAGTKADLFVNRGVVSGDIYLGGGDDVFVSRKGFMTGQVYGGDGNDTFAVGRSQELVDGGAGTHDVIDFRFTRGITVSLENPGLNTGVAAGDSYFGVEDLWGSLAGADSLTGNSAANALYGNGGGDTLTGGAGADTLVGGLGRDRLIGGLGDDRFFFQNLGERGDVIEDFSDAVGNNDSLQILGRAFARGLVAGESLSDSQFLARSSNLATSQAQRFVFRTGDSTLWFDPDGKGRAKPVLLVDLPDGVALGAADIFIV